MLRMLSLLAAALLAVPALAPAETTGLDGKPAPSAGRGGDLARVPEVARYVRGREPIVIWNEMLAARDEIHLLVDREDLQAVRKRVDAMNELKRELYFTVEYLMDMDTQEKRIVKERRADLRRLSLFKRGLNILWMSLLDLNQTAQRGAPGAMYAHLELLDARIDYAWDYFPPEFVPTAEATGESDSVEVEEVEVEVEEPAESGAERS